MKNYWGKGIVISIIVFFIITAVMVWIAFIQKVDLVANNYYDKEIKYQEQIDLMNNSKLIKGKFLVNQTDRSVKIRFPDSLDYPGIMGNIKFYRPSDKDIDFSIPLMLNDSGEMSVISDKITHGLWKLQINWTLKDKKYFNEESIMIQ